MFERGQCITLSLRRCVMGYQIVSLILTGLDVRLLFRSVSFYELDALQPTQCSSIDVGPFSPLDYLSMENSPIS